MTDRSPPGGSSDPLAVTVPETEDDRAATPELPRRLGRFELGTVLGAGGMGVVFEAHDPLLGRRVAVKVVRTGAAGSGALQARLLREAQALASLHHDHVVTLFDAGIEGNAVFIAMELVDGTTLDQWLTTPRPWREVVATFIAAGRGLAAAHAARLVHRDFKPANVLIDRGGRAKVTDFGLVALERDRTTVDGDDGTATDDDDGDERMTAAGAVMGTPAYMPPEQRRGEDADARSDQYAFCVSLREALIGGRSRAAGIVGAPPARLLAIVGRGAAEEPAGRYPSMTALLADLERVIGARPRRTGALALGAAGIAAVAVAVVVVAVVVMRPSSSSSSLSSGAAADPCAGASRRLDGIWDQARRAAIEQRFVAADREQGSARLAIATSPLDRFASDWTTMHVEACRANRETGAESDALFDRRMRCLDRRLAELRGTAAVLHDARDLPAIDQAVVAVGKLGGLDACADDEALLALTPPPEDRQTRMAVDAVYRVLDDLEAVRRQGRLEGLDLDTAAAVERARTVGHPPLLAAALRVRARVLLDTEAHAAAALALRELTEIAAEARDDVTAAWAWAELLRTVGYDEGKRDEALALLPAARAAVKRAPPDPATEALFLGNEALVLQLAARGDEAQQRLAEGRAVLDRAGAMAAGSELAGTLAAHASLTAALDHMAGRYADAEHGFRDTVAASSRAFGPDHPDTATAWHALGEALRSQGRGADALPAYQDALRIRSARLADSPAVANTLIALAETYVQLDREDDALAAIERAERILDHAAGASPADVASASTTMANVYMAMRKNHEALKRFDAAIASYAALPGEHLNLGVTHYNRGELLARMEHCDRAIRDYTNAAAMLAEQLGAQHPNLIFPLAAMGRCQVFLGRHDDALTTLDLALAFPSAEGAELSMLQARWYRGRALVESGRDVDGGLRAVRGAMTDMKAMASAAPMLGEAQRWLELRGR